MKQNEFFTLLESNKRMQSELQRALKNGGDGLFYFTLGEIFGNLGINGWESDRFIEKVCEICNIELQEVTNN